MKDILIAIGYGFIVTMSGIGGSILINCAYCCITGALLNAWIPPIVGAVCVLFSIWVLENNNK